MKKIKLLTMATMSTLLCSCAVPLLQDLQGSAPVRDVIISRQKMFSDEIISYGIPSKPIKNHEYAIAMAGQQYGYLIQPTDINYPKIFLDIFHQVDTQYLAITTETGMSGTAETQVKSLKTISFDVDHNQIRQQLIFFFIKPVSKLKENEQSTMEQLRFQCSTKSVEKTDYLLCRQYIQAELTITTKAQNTDQLAKQFKSPFTFDFYQVSRKNKYNFQKIALSPLFPVALTYDILSVPVLFGLAAMGVDFYLPPNGRPL